MEGSMAQINHVEGEEEYVLLDLDDVCVRADIPANAPYVLSGLDTAKPVLVIGDLKLIGEYQETMGTCYIFSEDGAPTVTCSEMKPSETNVFKDKQFLDSKQAPSKQVKPIASLHKILKFKLVSEDQNEMAEGRHSTWLPNIIDQRVEWNWKESNVALTVIRLDRSPAPHVFFFIDMLPGWPPHCREAQPFLPDVMGGRKDKDRRWKKELGLYMYEGYNLYYSKKGIPRTNIIATRDTFSVMLLIIDMEEEEEEEEGLEAICMKV